MRNGPPDRERAFTEARLRRHPALRAATAVTGDGERPPDEELVGRWQRHYEAVYASSGDSFGADFAGWDSPVDGRPIDPGRMREWRDEAVRRIWRLRPHRVLEVGVGSGLVLSQLAGRCTEYWATDVSSIAVERLAAQVRRAGLTERVRLRCQPAHDLSGLPAGRFDTVVLNSVVQYFPSGRYLAMVLSRLVDLLVPGGAVFVGDVRRLALLPVYRTELRLRRLPAVGPSGWPSTVEAEFLRRLRAAVTRDLMVEEELLVEPDLFAALPRRLPRVTGVEVRLKGGRHRDELAAYRYDVTVWTAPDVADVSGARTVAWDERLTDSVELSALLRERRLGHLRLVGVPNARLAGAIRAAEALPRAARAAELWSTLRAGDGVDPGDVARVAAGAGCRAALTWSRRGPAYYDAVLVAGADQPLGGLYPPSPEVDGEWPAPAWTSRP